MKISGERRLSHDLNQEQMELPATYIYRSTMWNCTLNYFSLLERQRRDTIRQTIRHRTEEERHFRKIGLF